MSLSILIRVQSKYSNFSSSSLNLSGLESQTSSDVNTIHLQVSISSLVGVLVSRTDIVPASLSGKRIQSSGLKMEWVEGLSLGPDALDNHQQPAHCTLIGWDREAYGPHLCLDKPLDQLSECMWSLSPDHHKRWPLWQLVHFQWDRLLENTDTLTVYPVPSIIVQLGLATHVSTCESNLHVDLMTISSWHHSCAWCYGH